MKNLKICLLILILISIVVIPNICIASSDGHIQVENYKPNELQSEDVGAMAQYGGRIAGFIQVVGTIVSIGTLMVIGIRYMVSSAEEKAEYKERMVPYIIGAVLLFAASTFVNIIYSIASNM